MKNLIILFFAILNLLTINTFCQTKTNTFNNYSQTEKFKPYYFNLDSFITKAKSEQPIVIWGTEFDPGQDTSGFLGVKKIGPFNVPGNLWQIGRPLKPSPLNTTVTPPNALLTDTVNPYPVNSNSSFELHFGRQPGYENLCWSWMLFQFRYRIVADSASDGMFVEIMYNGSNQWQNIIFDTMADVIDTNHYNAYRPTDTLFNGEPGTSFQNQVSIDQGWNVFEISWSWNNINAHLVDSVAFRVTFISDSLNTNKGGVLIDGIYVVVSDMCNVGVNEIHNKDNIVLFPNPVNKGGNLFIESDFTGNTKVKIYEIEGTLKTEMLLTPETKHIDVSTLNQGIYILKFINTNFCYQKKIVIN